MFVKFVKNLIVGQIRSIFSNIWRFFQFYQNETECNNEIVINVKATSKTWTETLDPDPEKPGVRKTWTRKHLDSENSELWKNVENNWMPKKILQDHMVEFINIENLLRLLSQSSIYNGGLPRRYLTVKNHKLLMPKGSVIDLSLGSKYASEWFLISVWFLRFYYTLWKEQLEVDLKGNPLK